MYRQCRANRRAGQLGSMAISKSVPASRSPATNKSQSWGIVRSSTVSGWYAQARSSAGVGSTGFAKPRNAACCTLTITPVPGDASIHVGIGDTVTGGRLPGEGLFRRNFGGRCQSGPLDRSDEGSCPVNPARYARRVTGEMLPQRDLRMSDADRERVVGWLKSAVSEGRLTLGEFEERVDGVL